MKNRVLISIGESTHDFCIVPLGRLSAKRETDNHPLCGWVTKVIPKNLLTWYNKTFKLIATKGRRFYGKPDKQFGTYKMDVQVSHSVHTEVQKEDHIQPVSSGLARDNPNLVQV